MRNDVFIWTEIYNCGKIGKVCLDSYGKYHKDQIIHIFGTPQDFSWITPQSNYVFVDITNNSQLKNAFNNGHLGTAMLWADLIANNKHKYLIHIDSDVVFRSECLTDLYVGIDEGYDIVGPIRNYKNNPNNRDDVRHLDDLTQTLFFAFNREKISKYDIQTLTCMCRGTCNPLGNPTIDFFDPIMFDIIKNGGKVKHISHIDYGGCDYFGKRNTNGFPEQNSLIDYGNKLLHFSAVGSGMNFFNNYSKINVEMSYVHYALEKYALFCKLFYNENIIPNLNLDKYNSLNIIKDWYGKN